MAITGVSGSVGSRLARSLERRADVRRIVGIDHVVPHDVTSARFVFRQTDLRDERLVDALKGIDVLVHLAVRDEPVRDEVAMRALDVDGTRNVIEAAEQAGVRQVIHASSALAYGAWADNDVPLTEHDPVRGTPELSCSEHHRDIEQWLADWTSRTRSTDICILRLAVVLGPGVDNVATRMLESPRFTTVRGHAPPLQFLHLDDAVAAIEHAIDHRLADVYNVAAEGWLSMDEVVGILDRRAVSVPEEVAFSTTERLWKLGIGAAPPGVVAHLMHPWVVSPAKLVATGWQPRMTNRRVLEEAVADHADVVALGGIRFRTATVRRGVATAALSCGLLAVLLVRRLRPRVVRADARG